MERPEYKMTPEYVRQNLEVIHQNDGGVYHTFRDKAGEVKSTSYSLFPGVVLIFKEVHRPNYISNWRKKPEQGLLIEFCQKGQLECQIGEESLAHAAGDVILFRKNNTAWDLNYPLKDFRSVSIVVKPEELSQLCFDCFDMMNLEMDTLFQKYQLNQHLFRVLKSPHQLESIFLEIMNAPETIKLEYWKVKFFELLLLLNGMEPERKRMQQCRISHTQAVIAREAYRYMMDHLQERITITDLAKKLSTSPTQLKEGFRAVYGAPIQTFMREERIQAAAKLLCQTDWKIRDVAEYFGYINVSKFSAAFQAVKGMKPGEYKKRAEKERSEFVHMDDKNVWRG